MPPLRITVTQLTLDGIAEYQERLGIKESPATELLIKAGLKSAHIEQSSKPIKSRPSTK